MHVAFLGIYASSSKQRVSPLAVPQKAPLVPHLIRLGSSKHDKPSSARQLPGEYSAA